jgi:heme exporter protein D
MIQNFLYMNGYGLFVWAAFSITFISCAIVFYKTQKTLKKYEREFVKENSKIASQVLSSHSKII